jgi:hypothetical protein
VQCALSSSSSRVRFFGHAPDFVLFRSIRLSIVGINGPRLLQIDTLSQMQSSKSNSENPRLTRPPYYVLIRMTDSPFPC